MSESINGYGYEILRTDKATYYSPYHADSRIQLHPGDVNRLKQVAGAQLLIPTIEKAMDDLNIERRINVVRRIPENHEYWRIHPETGLGCRSIGNDVMELFFDYERPDVAERIEQIGPRIAVHELNHLKRLEGYELHPHLLGAMVTEGIAIYYEENWGNQRYQSHWGHVLSEEEVKLEFEKAQEGLFDKDFDFADWFYGANNGHKRFAGYSLGLAIVEMYVANNTDVSISQLTLTSPEEIISSIRHS